ERLKEIAGIGADLSEKIKEFYENGDIHYYQELLSEFPKEVLLMLKIPGLGPKTVKMLYQKLNITTIAGLKKMAEEGRLKELPHIKEKTEQNIIKGIELIKKGDERMVLGAALPLAEEIIAELKDLKEVKIINYAGSLRRMRETVRDIDILAGSEKPQKVIDRFTSLGIVKKITAKGDTKASILTDRDIQVDLRVVKRDEFGAALQYFTGSQNHNIHLRQIAQKKGLKVNEYGVFKQKTGEKIAGENEEDVYKSLGMSWIAPELREDRGEIESAIREVLPKLIEIKDIKGDLHVHSDWSDGRYSLERIIELGYKQGHRYIAITDHSKSLGVAHGLDEERLIKQIAEIKKIEKRYKDFKILCGTEVDIKSDGSLDFGKDILNKLDIVVAAIHSGFKQDREKITSRLLSAIESGLVDIIAHPSGRIIGERESYDVDWDKIFQAAAKYKVALEISSHFLRLDLTDTNVMRAKKEGALFAINTDAHQEEHFAMLKYGVAVGRRGWLSKKDVINCLDHEKLVEFLKKRR
ncbi:MAG TPA: DNA polymerase/3'-5' exonuclease PolX, partial [Candidatus Omnitrophica bacterium]|nr:DNA polymerase/3'-5' exonuclease PolX [Candidatus Omnitrophota bacterium]